MKRRGSIKVGFVLLLLPVLPLRAQEGSPQAEPIQSHPEGDAAISRLRSPYCPGLMLEVCPTTQAKMLRDSLQVMAHQGASSDSIMRWMLTNHGEEYRAVPEARGSGLLAWVIPPLGLLVGLLAVGLALRRFRERREEDVAPHTALTPEDESVLAKALQELKAAEEIPF